MGNYAAKQSEMNEVYSNDCRQYGNRRNEIITRSDLKLVDKPDLMRICKARLPWPWWQCLRSNGVAK